LFKHKGDEEGKPQERKEEEKDRATKEGGNWECMVES
jgi:hypothetical protein